MTKVAFQGEQGAYSESAVYQFFGAQAEAKPCREFRDVFENVQKQQTDFGVVPVENSLEGSVNQNYDLFLDYDLKVCGEVIVKIDHCLITNPTVEIDAVATVFSHPQALAQCRKYLEQLGRELVPTYDTAGSVKMLKENKLQNAAAVASQRAAQLYNMKILKCDIADNKENYTRFFVLSQKDAPATGKDKTSIIFSASDTPGSLYHALGEFAKRDINLTKIESRPTKQTPWQYNFYLDLNGHHTEPQCAQALQALKQHSAFIKILGSYPKAT
ncbi:MAG: prephenate dehydratase [Candidatus Bathyarchaeota archaeon]|nr:prephenate dehydratase [Candidatus Bathyarchaeota archaeon]